MADIIVLMSTYNGEKYLKEQIDSILAQKDVDLILFVRDDGSMDSTCAILEDYADAESIVWMNEGEHKNLGLKDSFLLLLKEAYYRWPEALYFSFSDQDDVWLEDKLKRALDMVKGKESDKGVLYYGPRISVDKDLNMIKEEHIPCYNDYQETLLKSIAPGCTMVFDRVLAKFVFRYNPTVTEYHDSWTFRLAKSIGTKIIIDTEAKMLYRQHDVNVVGEESMNQCQKISIKEIIMRILPFDVPEKHFMQKSLREIHENYSDSLDPEAKEWMELVENYDKNFKAKWKLLTKPEIHKRGGANTPSVVCQDNLQFAVKQHFIYSIQTAFTNAISVMGGAV